MGRYCPNCKRTRGLHSRGCRADPVARAHVAQQGGLGEAAAGSQSAISPELGLPILVARGLPTRTLDAGGLYESHRLYSQAWGRQLVPAWVSWVESMQPQVQVHLAARFPLSRRQNVSLVDELQRFYRQASGTRPRAVLALQQNERGGEHSHTLLCGGEEIRDVSRKLAFQLARILGARMVGADQAHDQVNELRALILPVTARGAKRSEELSAYVVRYVLREDREQSLEVLP